MNLKTYYKIMNRIRELIDYDENASKDNLTIKIHLVDGKTLQATMNDIKSRDDYLEVWAPNKNPKTISSVPVSFVPFENILSISI